MHGLKKDFKICLKPKKLILLILETSVISPKQKKNINFTSRYVVIDLRELKSIFQAQCCFMTNPQNLDLYKLVQISLNVYNF